MPLVVECEKCRQPMRVRDELVGQAVRCPRCGGTFTARTGSPAAAEGAVPASAVDEIDFLSQRRRDLVPHRGVLILVLGVVGMVNVWGALIGPVAWILGHIDCKEIREGRMDPEGWTPTRAGWVLGIIATCLWGSIAVLYCMMFGMMFMRL